MCKRSSYYVLLLIVTCTRGVWSTMLNYNNQNNKNNYTKASGSTDTTIENYPYTALLEMNNGNMIFYCGGAILNRNNIVTTARCLDGTKRIKVRIGSTYSDRDANLYGGGFEYLTSSFSIHPRYDSNTGDFDVGVVNVDRGMNLDGEKSSSIRLPGSTNDPEENEVMTITGWSSFESSGSKPGVILQMAKVSVISRKECRLKTKGISTRMFCAKGGSNICKVDYGSPAMGQQRVLNGIASYSANCSDPNMPGVYTRMGQSVIRSYLRSQTGM